MAEQTTRRGRLPLKLPEIDWADIEAKGDPFDSALDIFGLKGFAEGLKNIVEGVELPFTILLDGRWGTGKTVFIKQWVVMMRKAGARVVYFDAFRHDYHEDAFAALVGAILREFEKAGLKEQKPKIWEAFRKQAADLAIALGFGTLKGLAGLFTAGVAAAVLEEGEETVREQYERSLAARVDTAFTLESHLEAFRKVLSEAAAAPLPDSKSEGANDKAAAVEPYLIVVIDELDRCRPDFALKILELVKHVFQTDSLCFIISADTRNIGKIIRAKYGNDVDSMDYLRKFYDLYYPFANSYDDGSFDDDPVSHEPQTAAIKYAKFCEGKGIFNRDEMAWMMYAFCAQPCSVRLVQKSVLLLNYFQLSYRQIEKDGRLEDALQFLAFLLAYDPVRATRCLDRYAFSKLTDRKKSVQSDLPGSEDKELLGLLQPFETGYTKLYEKMVGNSYSEDIENGKTMVDDLGKTFLEPRNEVLKIFEVAAEIWERRIKNLSTHLRT